MTRPRSRALATPPRRSGAGFTLAELLVVTVAIGILAAAALPQYQKTVERSYWRSARDVLQTIYAGEQVYWTTNDAYTDPAGNWAAIYMEDPNTGPMPVTFTVVTNGLTGAAATFTATATYTTGETQTVDQTRTFGGDWSLP